MKRLGQKDRGNGTIRVTAVAAVVASIGLVGLEAKEAKLSPAELVERHLNAIGAAETRSATASRLVEGSCLLTISRGGAGSLNGKLRLFSEGRSLKLELPFGHSDYWGESISFDGRKTEVGFVQPVRRSGIGEFLNTYDVLLREGLVGGVLSTAWPLFDLSGRKPKLKYEGLKKIDNQLVHELKYKADKGQGEITVRIYLDPDTYLHVRTVYELFLRPALPSSIEQSAGQQETHYHVEEVFSDFGVFDGLTLPKRWKLNFGVEGASRSVLWRFDNTVEKIGRTVTPSPRPTS